MKLCKDCAFGRDSLWAFCRCSKNLEGDAELLATAALITGRVHSIIINPGARRSCAVLRSEGWLVSRLNGTCGKSGRWFKEQADGHTNRPI